MTKRTTLAAATLTALPVFSAATYQPISPGHPAADSAHHLRLPDSAAGPYWAYAWGMEGEEALLFGAVSLVQCSFFGPVGSTACALTGLL